jgi:hypothetical protein
MKLSTSSSTHREIKAGRTHWHTSMGAHAEDAHATARVFWARGYCAIGLAILGLSPNEFAARFWLL